MKLKVEYVAHVTQTVLHNSARGRYQRRRLRKDTATLDIGTWDLEEWVGHELCSMSVIVITTRHDVDGTIQ